MNNNVATVEFVLREFNESDCPLGENICFSMTVLIFALLVMENLVPVFYMLVFEYISMVS